jgi:hypothetical protein
LLALLAIGCGHDRDDTSGLAGVEGDGFRAGEARIITLDEAHVARLGEIGSKPLPGRLAAGCSDIDCEWATTRWDAVAGDHKTDGHRLKGYLVDSMLSSALWGMNGTSFDDQTRGLDVTYAEGPFGDRAGVLFDSSFRVGGTLAFYLYSHDEIKDVNDEMEVVVTARFSVKGMGLVEAAVNWDPAWSLDVYCASDRLGFDLNYVNALRMVEPGAGSVHVQGAGSSSATFWSQQVLTLVTPRFKPSSCKGPLVATFGGRNFGALHFSTMRVLPLTITKSGDAL